MSRQTFLLAVIVTVVALGATARFVYSNPVRVVTITAWDRTLGNPKAAALIVEYASPQCPDCSKFDVTYFPTFKKKYIDTGKVYYALRVYPIGAADVAAEAIARCLPASRYFQFMDLLWRNQVKWDPEFKVPDVHAGLVEMGRIAGLSADKVDACIGNRQIAQKIAEVGDEATRKYGVGGVPAFVINGRTRLFDNDWIPFQKVIDDAVDKRK